MDKDQNKKESAKSKLNCWEVMMCGREQGGTNAGDLLVLSSDGLHKKIPDPILISILNAATDLKTKAKSLVKAALDAGGKDNITIVITQG
jgi:serine/threonine protein phosphatase PrpC